MNATQSLRLPAKVWVQEHRYVLQRGEKAFDLQAEVVSPLDEASHPQGMAWETFEEWQVVDSAVTKMVVREPVSGGEVAALVNASY